MNTTLENITRLIPTVADTEDLYPFTYDWLPVNKYSGGVVAAWIAASLSILGSVTILYLLIRRRNFDSLYDRLILGISTADLVVSLTVLFNPLVLPEWTDLVFAQGTFQTCEWAGFFLYFFLSGTVYNGALSAYFLLTIRYFKTEKQVSRLLEPWVHLIAFFLPLIVGTLAMVDHGYNPHALYGLCLLAAYPPDCLLNESVECERGENDTIASLFVVATHAVFGIGGIICTWLVYWTVRQQTHRSHKRYLRSVLEDVSTSVGSSLFQNATSQQPTLDAAKQKRIRTVGMQAVLYTLAYLNGFVWVVFANVVEGIYTKDLAAMQSLLEDDNFQPLLYAAFFLLLLMFPIQGFFNAIIYLRPRLLRWKDSNADNSWLWAFRQVLSGSKVPISRRTCHLRIAAPINDVVPSPKAGTTGGTGPGSSDQNIGIIESDETHRTESVTDRINSGTESREISTNQSKVFDADHTKSTREDDQGSLQPIN